MALTFIEEHGSDTGSGYGLVHGIHDGLVTVLVGNDQEEWTFPAAVVPADVTEGALVRMHRTEHGWAIDEVADDAPTIVWDDDLDAKLDKVRDKRPSLFARPPVATPPAPRPLRPSEFRRQNLHGTGARH